MALLAHRYGPDIRILADPFLLTLLARIGAPETGTAQLPQLVRSAYHRLCTDVLAHEFPVVHGRVQTRMSATEAGAFYHGPLLCRDTRLVIGAVIRAGILPSQACYEAACEVLPPQNVRLDFLNMSRTLDEQQQVTGVRLDGSKIGGPVDDAVVLLPDPMGATGGTLCRAVEIYRALGGRPPRAIVAMHLMVTPEAIQRLVAQHAGVRLYAGRLDRGLSPDHVLRSEPGTFPELERGLNDVQYIVPGAGGMGELLTNSWV
ncbi:MAG TPA: uracil phosphoribosyltransferase [Planctomycetota bacterium]|nr:uracil phosphoribosyltransferase [Planctomycetota bacterium]